MKSMFIKSPNYIEQVFKNVFFMNLNQHSKTNSNIEKCQIEQFKENKNLWEKLY